MQDAPAMQYFFSRASLAYHQAESEILGCVDSICRRTITGEPAPTLNLDAVTVDRTMTLPPP